MSIAVLAVFQHGRNRVVRRGHVDTRHRETRWGRHHSGKSFLWLVDAAGIPWALDGSVRSITVITEGETHGR